MTSDQNATLAIATPDGRAIVARIVPEEAFDAHPQLATPGPDDALAYVLSPPRRVRFWTLGFEAPIDQVFVAPGGRVVQVLRARPPGDATLLGPDTDVALVIELAAGLSLALAIAPGVVLDVADGSVASAPTASPFIAITQSDRAGWFLACELRRRGHRVIHVHHTHHLDEVGEDQFDVELVYGDDLDEVLEPLRALGPRWVLAGSELGVNAADYLAEALGLPGNGTALSVARRHKAGMVEALRAAGVPVMRQIRARHWKRIMRWKDHFGLEEIVIKPVRSAGTDRVSSARDAAGVRRAVRAIIGATNRLGLAESEVVAQERLVGPEIYLNSVSRDGRHAVTEIWLETKRPARAAPDAPFAYDTFQLLPGDDVLAGYLGAWLGRVLDALGVRWGPAHTELILTADGPRLIDFGARLDGVLLPALNEECIGKSPVTLTADAYLDPGSWEAWAAEPYRLRKHATMVVVDNPCAGVLRDDTGLRGLSALPTFHALRPRWDVGEAVPATKDAFSYHAIVTLRDEDPVRVRADHAHIRRLEAADLLLDATPRAPGEAEPFGPSPFDDPRGGDAWGRALESLGWTTVSDPGGLVARVRDSLDGTLVWVPRQARVLRLDALERLRAATGAARVLVEIDATVTIEPLVGAPLTIDRWDAATEATLERLGLTPTLHAQAPSSFEILDRDPDALVAGTLTLAPEPATVAAVFAPLGDAARWPEALAAAGEGVLATLDGAAALALRHSGALHVAVVSARSRDELSSLLRTLATLAPVVAPAAGIDGARRAELPPTLRWARPRWAAHLDDADAISDAVGAPTTSTTSPLAAALAAREHPLATWDGALFGQATGRDPWWARTAPLLRAPPADAAHATAARAREIDLGAFSALGDKHDLLWIAWEPPGGKCRVIDREGRAHELDFAAPATALDAAARLELVPVRARWTARSALVASLERASPAHDATIVAAASLDEAAWADLAPARAASLYAARSFAALADGWLATAGSQWALGLLHDRALWILAESLVADRALSALAYHARCLGADLVATDAWDPRFPDEHADRRRELPADLGPGAVLALPPTLAFFC